MSNKKTVMVDMDDVIVSGGLLFLINQFMGTNYTESDFKDYYMQDIVPNKEEFLKWFVTQNMYDHCHLNGSVVEVLKEINKQYNTSIASSYILPEIVKESGIVLLHKYNYLIKNLPFISPYKFIFLGDKSRLTFDIKIDDRVDNLEGASTKILYTAYHNEYIPKEELSKSRILRANNWDEIGRILL